MTTLTAEINAEESDFGKLKTRLRELERQIGLVLTLVCRVGSVKSDCPPLVLFTNAYFFCSNVYLGQQYKASVWSYYRSQGLTEDSSDEEEAYQQGSGSNSGELHVDELNTSDEVTFLVEQSLPGAKKTRMGRDSLAPRRGMQAVDPNETTDGDITILPPQRAPARGNVRGGAKR